MFAVQSRVCWAKWNGGKPKVKGYSLRAWGPKIFYKVCIPSMTRQVGTSLNPKFQTPTVEADPTSWVVAVYPGHITLSKLNAQRHFWVGGTPGLT